MERKFCYEVLNDRSVFTSRLRAHNHICDLAKKNDLLPYKEKLGIWNEVLIYYPGGYTIRRKEMNITFN